MLGLWEFMVVDCDGIRGIFCEDAFECVCGEFVILDESAHIIGEWGYTNWNVCYSEIGKTKWVLNSCDYIQEIMLQRSLNILF